MGRAAQRKPLCHEKSFVQALAAFDRDRDNEFQENRLLAEGSPESRGRIVCRAAPRKSLV